MTVLLLSPVLLSAQNGVEVSGFNVDAGTVTFNVSWSKNAPNMPAVWSDTVWVFVDYNDNGTMKRLPLVPGATLTATSAPGVGKVEQLAGNTKGVRVIGNAKTADAGSFSAKVELYYNSATIVTGACVYASNYPPVAEYVDGKITFTGTPIYKIVFKDTGGSPFDGTSDGTYTILAGETIDSFTDKTGAPGIIKCLPSTVYELAASFAGFCPGGSVTFALSNAASGRVYRLYNGNYPVDELTGQAGPATFTGIFAGAGTYTARVDADGTHCAVAMNGTRTITANALPTAPIIAKPADVCYNGDPIVFTATDFTGALTWTAVTTGGTVTGSSVTYASGAATGEKTVKARSSQTYNGAPACESNEVQQTAEVYALPAIPTLTVTTGAGLTPATFTATGGSGSYKWNDYFDGQTEAVLYTPAEEGTYTAAVRAEQAVDLIVCVSPYTDPVTAIIQNLSPVGAECSLNTSCLSGICRCGICSAIGTACLNNYYYYILTENIDCPDGYTRVTTCNTVPDALASLLWTIRYYDLRDASCGSSQYYRRRYIYECRSKVETLESQKCDLSGSLEDKKYVLCYKKL
jgi:hypothetical protein